MASEIRRHDRPVTRWTLLKNLHRIRRPGFQTCELVLGPDGELVPVADCPPRAGHGTDNGMPDDDALSAEEDEAEESTPTGGEADSYSDRQEGQAAEEPPPDALSAAEAAEEPPPDALSAAEAAHVLGVPAQSEAQCSEWAARQQRGRENWVVQRDSLRFHRVSQEALPENARCVVCSGTEPVRVRCRSCSCGTAPMSTFLCASCDTQRHPHAHFHMREVFMDGYWQPVPMHMELQEHHDGVQLVKRLKYFPNAPEEACQHCDCVTAFHDVPQSDLLVRKVILIRHGKHDVAQVGWVCPVLTCRRPNWQGQEFFARRVDAWPATPKDNLCAHTFIHASVFVQWERMQFLCRAASLASYLKLLEAEGADYGNQGSIHEVMFQHAYNNWAAIEGSVLHKWDTKRDAWPCPACSKGCHSVHFDGNQKLFTYKNTWKLQQSSSGLMSFFVPDDDVVAHNELADELLGAKRNIQNTCGSTVDGGDVRWKAGKNSSAASEHLYLHGRVFGVCRHGVVLCASNLVRTGERFAYAHYMLIKLLERMDVSMVNMDVGCMWIKWAKRLHDAAARSSRSRVADVATKAWSRVADLATKEGGVVVNEMHAKGHDSVCQVLHGQAHCHTAARDDGEHVERWNAHISRKTNTRFMAPEASNLAISLDVHAWNENKRQKQILFLVACWERNEKRLPKDERAWRALQKEHQESLPEGTTLQPEKLASEVKRALELVGTTKALRDPEHKKMLEIINLRAQIETAKRVQAWVGDEGSVQDSLLADMRFVAESTKADGTVVAMGNAPSTALFLQMATLVDKLPALETKLEGLVRRNRRNSSRNVDVAAEQRPQQAYVYVVENLQRALEADILEVRGLACAVKAGRVAASKWSTLNDKRAKFKKNLGARVQTLNAAITAHRRTLLAHERHLAFKEVSVEGLADLLGDSGEQGSSSPWTFPWDATRLKHAAADAELPIVTALGLDTCFRLHQAWVNLQRSKTEKQVLRKEANAVVDWYTTAMEETSDRLAQLESGASERVQVAAWDVSQAQAEAEADALHLKDPIFHHGVAAMAKRTYVYLRERRGDAMQRFAVASLLPQAGNQRPEPAVCPKQPGVKRAASESGAQHPNKAQKEAPAASYHAHGGGAGGPREPSNDVPLASDAPRTSAAPTLEQQVAVEQVKKRRNVFITGSAGTGKSFILKSLVEHLRGESRVVHVTASTGNAARQLDGATLHAFAGAGLATGDVPTLVQDIRNKPAAVRRWTQCQVLVIDEISMVQGFFFTKLDEVARRLRNDQRVFGGLQLVVCGDFFQLPPFGGAPGARDYAFLQDAWEHCAFETVELQRVHRQADATLVRMLQLLRRGVVDESVERVLRQCADTVLGEGATRIAARNKTVDAHNEAKLDELQADAISFQAVDQLAAEDTFSALDQGPLERTVVLKAGALVVVVMNDSSTDLLNGDRGTVEALSAHGARVRFDRTGAHKWVQPRTWTSLGGSTRTQLPLRLAWALTVHRCQGMTLERVEVDLEGVFQVGQAYTALSRATSLAGLRVTGLDKWLSIAKVRKGINVADEVLRRFPSPTEAAGCVAGC